MDRYVLREPRVRTNYPQGNQMIAYATNVGGNNTNMVPSENVYYEGSYPTELPTMTPMRRLPSEYAGMPHTPFPQNLMPFQGQVMSGIDPRYLAGYSDNVQYITTGQPTQREVPNMSPRFGHDYQNRSFAGPEKNHIKSFTPQTANHYDISQVHRHMVNNSFASYDDKTALKIYNHQPQTQPEPAQQQTKGSKKSTEQVGSKKDAQYSALSRADKLKALHKSGPRAFSGPVEKVLKWHKALQDIGVFVFYEIVGPSLDAPVLLNLDETNDIFEKHLKHSVSEANELLLAKCVSVRAGEACAKNLVVRDDNGPAMQVVYYEIDFLLPELKPPCVVRVIGRMMPGTCRLQAFSVRLATGDDVATLSRRAAAAAHHVARLCKEFGVNI